ncbi:hypothetical protein [Planctomyces sp. SH-PL14]|uniref:hypothetical protein n=1 Tax=Planctomyces sp. SH-PL14 TaxID=1632864 RepID=UPI00078E4B99|nr:hypothetical protein [Planctomyces sp. SH-PL14]AMV21264.1 hypothetical protein VT03_25405 [Planctomyces sp. SH-PL14]
MSPSLHACLLLVPLLAAGCGGKPRIPNLSPVRGVVTYKGSPAAGLNVSFVPASGPAAFATTGSDGTFVLKTNGQSGAVAGKHAICLAPSTPPPMPGTPESKRPLQPIFPAKYANLRTSGLTATVPTDGKPVELILKD